MVLRDIPEMKIAIIGAGIVGLSVARELSRYDAEIHIFEREEDVGMGTSKANTGIIHAGFDDPPNSVRAQYARRGNEIWHRWVQELHIPTSWKGEIIVARDYEGMKKIEELKRRGIENGVPGLEIWDRTKLLKMEPKLSKEVQGALFAQSGGVMESFFAPVALYENLRDNGVFFHFNAPVEDLIERGDKIEIRSRVNDKFDLVINAAGLYADRIAEMMGYSFRIFPKKGEYLLFPKITLQLNYIIFPTPHKGTKGVVIENTPAGTLMIGPNAQEIGDKEDKSTTAEGLDFVYNTAKSLVPSLPPREKSMRQFSGLRAETEDMDFIITLRDNFWNLAGMRSPGLTAAPAIAEHVAAEAKKRYNLKRREGWVAKRVPYPRGGKLVCDCEGITEMEVREAVRRGAGTVEGVKRRTMATMGSCQGSFCIPKIMSIIAEERSLEYEQVLLKDSGWIVRKIKKGKH